MPSQIDALSHSQAILAVKLLYDYIPSQDGDKPSEERVKTVAEALSEETDGQAKEIATVLLAEEKSETIAVKAEFCRLVLRRAESRPEFAAPLKQALAAAVQPHMAIDPATGVFIILLFLGTSQIHHKPGGELEITGAGTLRDMVKTIPDALREFTALVKALPEDLLRKFGSILL